VLGRSDLHPVNEAGHMVINADTDTLVQAVDNLNISVEEPLRITRREKDRSQPTERPSAGSSKSVELARHVDRFGNPTQ
jgi:hypothetical protein